MTSPRHLWSGDWQLDSEAAAEELAKRRARPRPPEEGPEPPPGPPRPSLRQRIRALLAAAARFLADVLATIRRRPPERSRRSRPVAAAVLIACLTLLSAGVAFAVTSMLVDSGKHKPNSAARAWLGVKLADAPQGGARIIEVAPHGPAASAGLQTGDVITAIDNQQVQTAGDVSAALDGLVAGNTIQVQFDRGPSGYSTQATLAPPHSGP